MNYTIRHFILGYFKQKLIKLFLKWHFGSLTPKTEQKEFSQKCPTLSACKIYDPLIACHKYREKNPEKLLTQRRTDCPAQFGRTVVLCAGQKIRSSCWSTNQFLDVPPKHSRPHWWTAIPISTQALGRKGNTLISGISSILYNNPTPFKLTSSSHPLCLCFFW